MCTSKAKKEDIRLAITYTAGCVAFVAGIGLSVWGFVKPPEGEISGSVLTFAAEALTFFGAIFGISGYTAIKMRQIDSEVERKRNEINV